MNTKVKIEKIEAKVAICPVCKKEITNMRSEYCQHLLRWDDKFAYFKIEPQSQEERMSKLRSKCHGAEVKKGLAMSPIMYQKSFGGEPYSYFCVKCGNPTEVEEKGGHKISRKNVEFLYGKGHACNYCDSNKESCHRMKDIKEYAQKEKNVSEMSIQIFACSSFKKEAT